MISAYGGLSIREKLSIWFDKNLNRIEETNCDVCNRTMKSYQTPIKIQKKIIVCSSECLRKATNDLSKKIGEDRIGCLIILQENRLIQKHFDMFETSYPLNYPLRTNLERLGYEEGIKISSVKVLS